MPTRLLTAFLALLFTLSAAHAAAVDTILGTWSDAARSGRAVPYKIYIAHDQTAATPVVLFSHGFGGSREGSAFLLSYLAEHGYVVVAVQHAGSDTPAVFPGGRLDQAGLKMALTAGVATDRFRDIPFAIDMLEQMNATDAQLKGRLDMKHVGLSGHSYGAITTLALAGQGFGPTGRFSFADERLKAAIAYSPSKPRTGDPATVFSDVHIPTFHMTGTDDRNPLDASEAPENRQIPYKAITTADKFLIVFKNGDHMIYSGRRLDGGPRPTDEHFHALIQQASLAFWDMYLKGNADAKAYLTGGKFANDLGADGTFEFQLR